MKRVLIVAALFSVFTFQSCKKPDSLVDLSQLPTVSQEVIATHFGDYEVSHILKDADLFIVTYTATFTTGDDIEFNKKGEWEDINCEYTRVPESIIPAEILVYVSDKFPNNYIVKIEKDRSKYEVTLDSDFQIIFGSNYNVVRYGD
ncbi:MAG: PepSY-like domain-containing protein [Bacteroidales bacterium]|nr:PepSY-like domain-containing protein [Bacteroidales bacterium]